MERLFDVIIMTETIFYRLKLIFKLGADTVQHKHSCCKFHNSTVYRLYYLIKNVVPLLHTWNKISIKIQASTRCY